MTAAIRIGAHQARLLHLGAQGLLLQPRRRARSTDVHAAIERMRLLQIDTINVVARSPYLVLFSRLGTYRSEWLEALLAAGGIFECWAHEACFAPSNDYGLHRRHASGRDGHWAMKIAQRMRRDHSPGMQAVLAHITANGPAKSSDFERGERGGGAGWWGWKDEKRWLEALFATGELMIARRENFQRVYDLRERVLAHARSTGHMSTSDVDVADADADMRRAFVLGAVRALGVTEARWINDYFRTTGRLKDADLDAHVAAGELIRIEVDEWKNVAYVHPEHAATLDAARRGRLRATRTTLLSPFDPVVWDRERATAMFGFDYRLECYTPEAKRRWGYYVLPILHRGRLVGRLDAKAHRSDGLFEVKALFLEAATEANAALADALANALRECAQWHGTPEVVIRRCDPPAFKRLLKPALQASVAL